LDRGSVEEQVASNIKTGWVKTITLEFQVTRSIERLGTSKVNHS
jgi:hypothetical protein